MSTPVTITRPMSEHDIEWYIGEVDRLNRALSETQQQLRASQHEVSLRGYTINKLSNRIGRQRKAHRRYRDNLLNRNNNVNRLVRIINERIGQMTTNQSDQ